MSIRHGVVDATDITADMLEGQVCEHGVSITGLSCPLRLWQS